MPNDRLSQIEAKFELKSDARDAELKLLRDQLVRVTEAERGNIAVVGELGARLRTIEDRPEPRPPGILELWGPTLATAVAMGSLFGYILSARVDPFAAELTELKLVVKQNQQHVEVREIESRGVEATNTEHLRETDRRIDIHRDDLNRLAAQVTAEIEKRAAESRK